MSQRKLIAFVSVIFSLILANHSNASPERVARVIDGDTILMLSGEYVRILQFDAPELREQECFSTEAKRKLQQLINDSRSIELKKEMALGEIDSYGRILRHVLIDGKNASIVLVRMGAGTPWFYKGQKGKYSGALIEAARDARKNKSGLWRKCPNTKLNFFGPIETGFANVNEDTVGVCDPNYYGCVPTYPPDLDCKDIRLLKIAPVKIKKDDVHKLDRDGDGIGCN